MELVMLPDHEPSRPLPFFLALEEWLARRHPDRDFFFLWQVEPTVIVGRHQLLEQEVDVEFCRKNGIDLVRRKSGGGAVLADMNNIMFSYITSSDSVTTTFASYTSMVARSLRLLGLDASDNSRNDILIGDRKVSGNSFYHIPGRSIVHGTMLYDYDPVLMGGALTPPTAKLESHGVKSVRSRVTTIREHLPELSLPEFIHHIVNTIPDGPVMTISREEIREVEEIEKTYHDHKWLTGQNPAGTLDNTVRIEGVGTLTVHLTVSKGKVRTLTLTGDYLEIADDAAGRIESIVRDVAYNREALSSALSGTDLGKFIPGLKNKDFIDLIC